MGDVEDVEIYVAQPILEWQQTAHGKWVMQNASDLKYHTFVDYEYYGYHVVIEGCLEGKQVTEYFLRWPK